MPTETDIVSSDAVQPAQASVAQGVIGNPALDLALAQNKLAKSIKRLQDHISQKSGSLVSRDHMKGNTEERKHKLASLYQQVEAQAKKMVISLATMPEGEKTQAQQVNMAQILLEQANKMIQPEQARLARLENLKTQLTTSKTREEILRGRKADELFHHAM